MYQGNRTEGKPGDGPKSVFLGHSGIFWGRELHVMSKLQVGLHNKLEKKENLYEYIYFISSQSLEFRVGTGKNWLSLSVLCSFYKCFMSDNFKFP